jgi:hypothetical protein
VTIAVPVFGFASLRLRKQERRLAIADLATCDGDTGEKKKAKADTRAAIAKARDDADLELARLSRLTALRRGKLEPDSEFKGWWKAAWFLCMGLTWLCFFNGAFYGHSFMVDLACSSSS